MQRTARFLVVVLLALSGFGPYQIVAQAHGQRT